MTQWVVTKLGVEVPMHFTAFFPSWKMMDRPATPVATLQRARRIARKNGVRYAFTGNVHDLEGDSTYCHACGEALIQRDWFTLTAWNLDEYGRCRACGTACAGVFEARPGSWGAKRQPISMAVAGDLRGSGPNGHA